MVELLATNPGGAPTNGEPVTITDTLPPGLTVLEAFGFEEPVENSLICEHTASTVTCTYTAEPLSGESTAGLVVPIEVEVESGVEGTLENTATVEGGGAPTVSTTEPVTVDSQEPPFGFNGPFSASAFDATGGLDTQAADHPNSATTSFVLNSVPTSFSSSHIEAAQSIKDVSVELPPGFVGDPQAAPTCPQYLVAPPNNGRGCPAASVIGTVAAVVGNRLWSFSGPINGSAFVKPLFNVSPEHGHPAQFAFIIANQEATLYASLVHTTVGYVVRINSPSITRAINLNAVKVTLFGDPALKDGGSTPSKAFFTNPSDCSQPGFTTTVHADSWPNPASVPLSSSGAPEFDKLDFAEPQWIPAAAQSPPVTGCDRLQFNPTFSLKPDNASADSPAGLNVDLKIPQNEDPEGLATPPLSDATVTLPKGLAVNPSSADGLAGCTEAQIAPDTTDPGDCPAASKIGDVSLETPLLDHVLHGSVYLGTPSCQPCTNSDAEAGKLINLYIEVNDPATGVVVKLPGSAAINAPGQLEATFTENPQLPFEDLKLNFKSGPRATLTTPPTCGHYTTETDLRPWSAPATPDATLQSGFDIGSGPGGSACASSEAALPNKPSFEAGTAIPIAGSYSPFVLKLTREPGSQAIKSIDTTLPPGLTGKLAGIPYCSEAQIAAAAQRSGAAEKATPSCPLASELGTVNVGAGSGTPFYVQGHAYLAGSYKGASLSLAIVTPAVAGPFDLGTVVVRAALYVNPETAQIHAVSDPIPTVLAGIPLDLRSVALNMARPNFTLNPTSCDPMAVTGTATSVLNQVAPLSERFQVGACGALGFKPKLKLSLKGGTKRAQNPALKAVLTARPGDANIGSAQVTLPHSEFLDNAHIRTVCTRVQFAANQCPAASIYGHARAITPLLDAPLEGPVYLRSSSNKLPDLVAALNGQINVDLDGRIDTGKGGGIRNSFELVPDAPVTKFVLEMKGGKKGLLVNSENVCRKPQRAVANFTAQNGKVHDFNPVLAVSCGKHGKKGKHHGKRGAAARHRRAAR